MNKHTPWPWFANGRSIKRDYRLIGLTEDAGEIIASVMGGETSGPRFIESSSECQANARLIAAAPELLDALKQIKSNANMYHAETISEIARAAIAKATGDNNDYV